MSGVRESTNDEKKIIDEVDSTTTYIGYAPVGTPTTVSQWKIKKLRTVGVIIYIEYAGGKETYANKWDDRAIITYS